jgi:hypothetical protein
MAAPADVHARSSVAAVAEHRVQEHDGRGGQSPNDAADEGWYRAQG